MTTTHAARALFLRGMDLAPWAGGGTLLWLGMQGNPTVALAGGLLLSLAGLQVFASANGYSLPRPGRVRIAAQGCGDPPLAFFVRHHGRGLLFRMEEPRGDSPDCYCVVAFPAERKDATETFGPFEAPEDSRLIGTVPADTLRFESRGGRYVDRANLLSVLHRLGA